MIQAFSLIFNFFNIASPCGDMGLECVLLVNDLDTNGESNNSTAEYKCVEQNVNEVVGGGESDGGDNEKDLNKLCRNKDAGTRVAHPSNPKEFLSCTTNDGGSSFILLMCPDELLYNKYTDRCDYSGEPISIGCGSMPCQYGSECIDLTSSESSSESSLLYKCVCAPGYSGVNCEIAPDFCASNPCSGGRKSGRSKSSRNQDE
jgi:hypothetical protein